ncbi:hypothetical protein [Paenibacillus gorillae]|uniref:hypothetical protein n=1 Tax=Paenibacillus gorillae TaxID=1243662 RepID=UPI0005A88442|nr:hypothetical protein [Paenibacillus gorillae]
MIKLGRLAVTMMYLNGTLTFRVRCAVDGCVRLNHRQSFRNTKAVLPTTYKQQNVKVHFDSSQMDQKRAQNAKVHLKSLLFTQKGIF